MDREAWRAAIHGVTKSRTWLRDWTELIGSENSLAPNQPAASLFLYNSQGMNNFYMVIGFFFLKQKQAKNMLRDHMWYAKPRIFTLWIFTEKVCQFLNKWSNWTLERFKNPPRVHTVKKWQIWILNQIYLFPAYVSLPLIMLYSDLGNIYPCEFWSYGPWLLFCRLCFPWPSEWANRIGVNSLSPTPKSTAIWKTARHSLPFWWLYASRSLG